MSADEKNRLLRGLMDAIPEAIVSMDVYGNITHSNKGIKDLLGYNSHNILGKPIYDFASSSSRKELKGLFIEIESFEKIRERNIRLYDFKGRLRNLRFSTSLIREDGGAPIGVVASLRDVESEARLERELGELQGFSQSLFKNPDIGIIAADLEGNIVHASVGAGRIYSKSPDELKGQNIIKDSIDPLLLNEKLQNLYKTGISFEEDSTILIRGGSRNFKSLFCPRWNGDGGPKGTIVVFSEISRQLEAEKNHKEAADVLRRYSGDLESLVELARNLGSSLDEDLIYETMGKGLERILSVDTTLFFRTVEGEKRIRLASVIGAGASEIQKESLSIEETDLTELMKPRIVRHLRSERSFYFGQKFLSQEMKSAVFVPIFSKEGVFGVLAAYYRTSKEFTKQEVDILQSIGDIGGGAIENAVLYQRIKNFAAELEEKVKDRTKELAASNNHLQKEIVQREKLGRELKKYSKELEQSNKLKDLFIDIMKHDLLKPADIARLSTELILDMEDDPEKKEILANILQSNVRIINLIENASVLAKLESGKRLEFKKDDLGKVLAEVHRDLEDRAAEKNTKVTVKSQGTYPAMLNPLIYDVFSNLVDNAIKYGPKSSEVVVKVSSEGSNWRISCADHGEGIPDRHKEAVFDRFKRLEKGGVKGSGLGLAIVKKVVNAHKGRVWVGDNPEGGSIFFVEIPKAES